MLGPYEILSPLGAGGMGEVYRAKDTNLDREVAVKVLPELFSRDPERVQRFQREAKVLASLNHPNIAAIYGFEDHRVDNSNAHFLVMELVEGDTLVERLKAGPMPVEEGLSVGKQMSEAIEAAHERGVIHRDLKPANVIITPEGNVKVLDFGLAKAMGPVDERSGTEVANSPTITADFTRVGTILGTAAYMSPEQARGKPLDKRTDIWSFGCVLYECLGGQRPFEGETATDLIAKILECEPDWEALPASTPRHLRLLLRRCLTKDRAKRLRDIGDARIELDELLQHPDDSDEPSGKKQRGLAQRLAWPVISVVLAAALGVALLRLSTLTEPNAIATREAAPVVTGLIQLTELPGVQSYPELSPDGKTLLYVTRDQQDLDIFTQRVGGEKSTNLTSDSPSDDSAPAFSPDGEHIAFRSSREGGGIFVMGATGESPRRVSKGGFDPAWSPDGLSLVFASEPVDDPYSRSTVSELRLLDVTSRETRLLTKGDAVAPSFSPSGKRIAYWASNNGVRDIFTIPSDGGPPRSVTQDVATDWSPFFSPDGKTLYFLSDRSGSSDLWRVAIDENSGEILGAPHPVTAGAGSIGHASLSADGRKIAFAAQLSMSQIERYEFDPKTERIGGAPKTVFSSTRLLAQFDVTQDGRRMAFRTGAPREDIVVMNTDGSGRRRLMDDVHKDRGPAWTTDGKWLLFYSNRGGPYDIWRIRPDGTDAQRLTNSMGATVTLATPAPDGKMFACMVVRAERPGMLLFEQTQSLGSISTPLPLPGSEVAGFKPYAFSPDGKYIAGSMDNSRKERIAVYSLVSKKVIPIKAPDGGEIDASGWGSPSWIDGNRFIGWDLTRATAYIYDVAADETRELPGILGPCDICVVQKGKALIVNRTRAESDIWMLTLGTIDNQKVLREAGSTPSREQDDE